MRFDITAHGPFVGKTTLPGDENLTLSCIALGMFSPQPVALDNPSLSPDVFRFREFLERHGIGFIDSSDGFSVHGKEWSNDLVIDDYVPDAILYTVISGVVFSGRTVTINNVTEGKAAKIRRLGEVLRDVGLPDEYVNHKGSELTIRGAVFSPAAEVKVRSPWALEAVGAAAMASRAAITISYPPQIASHSLKLLTILGYRSSVSDAVRNRETEMERRLAKASGEPAFETRHMEWTGKNHPHIQIPGDTMIAAALAGAASVIPKSNIALKGVLWEQGRKGFFDTLRRMKGNILYEQVIPKSSFDSANISIRWGSLEGIHLTSGQAQTFVTELMILGAIAAFAQGETVICDVGEEPRVGRETFTVLSRGLEMLGTRVGDYADGIVIMGGHELHGNLVDSCRYPGIVLALAVAGLNSSGTTTVFGFEEDTYPISEFIRIVHDLSSELPVIDE